MKLTDVEKVYYEELPIVSGATTQQRVDYAKARNLIKTLIDRVKELEDGSQEKL